jgi:NADH dehydrogenase
VLQGEFRSLDPSSLRIVLAEGADRLLPALAPELSERAKSDLEKLGVDVRLQTLVTEADERGVSLENGERIPSANAVWAAGFCGAPVERGLNTFMRRDRRLQVEPDLSLRSHSNVFAIGDLAYVESNGEAVPGLAPAALQMGKYVEKTLSREIGRGTSVADVGRFKFGGVVAWLLWVFVHIKFSRRFW